MQRGGRGGGRGNPQDRPQSAQGRGRGGTQPSRPQTAQAGPSGAGGPGPSGRGAGRGGTPIGQQHALSRQDADRLHADLVHMNLGAGGGAPAAAPARRGGDSSSAGSGGTKESARRRREGPAEKQMRDADVSVPRRPPSQPVGTPVQLLSNHFKVLARPSGERRVVRQYQVDFIPDVPSMRARQFLVGRVRERFSPYIFAGTLLWTPNLLDDQDIDVGEMHGTRYTMHLTRTVDGVDIASHPMVLNNLVRQALRQLHMVQIRRNYFDSAPGGIASFPQLRMEMWPGFVTAVNPHDAFVSVNVDSIWKVLRTDTVLDTITQIARSVAPNERRVRIREALLHSIVLTRYNNRTYPVHDVDFARTPLSPITFEWAGHGTATFAQYYEQAWGITGLVPSQPLLVSRKKRRQPDGATVEQTLHLIPQLCFRTGIAPEDRRNRFVMQQLTGTAAEPPGQRASRATQFLARLLSNPAAAEQLDNFGVTLDPNMAAVPGRVLPAPVVKGGPTGSDQLNREDPYEWIRGLRSRRLPNPKPLRKGEWAVAYCANDGKEYDAAEEIVAKLRQFSAPMGATVDEPTWIEVASPHPGAYAEAILKALGARARPFAIVLVLLPTDDKDRYDALKRLLHVERGLPMQGLVTRRYDKQRGWNASVVTKLALQMQAKLGACLWNAQLPQAPQVQNAMFIGVDVCHLAGRASVAGFVASLRPRVEGGEYFAQTRKQEAGGQELMDHLGECLKEALELWRKRNKGGLPSHVFFYRDGVGDGQLAEVVEREVTKVEERLRAAAAPHDPPKLCFIVVKKRINTRFFLREGAAVQNVRPGTVVDSVVTHRGWYDFFLASQHVTQGTATPTHYHVVRDGTNVEPAKLQLLTLALCYAYANWTGPVKVPAPCQLAHKLAFLSGQSLQARDAAPALRTTLHFL
eukprot:tig00020961_g16631.t1